MNLSDLNEEQLEAVTCDDGYVRVIAGAGSGKTRVLTCRYLFLVTERGVDPDRILALTFTRRAAAEMKRRIQAALSEKRDFPYVLTYHSFCNHLLRKEISALGYTHGYSLMNENRQKRYIQNLFNDGKPLDNDIYRDYVDMISEYKHRYPEYSKRMMDRSFPDHIVIEDEIQNDIIDRYLLFQRENRLLDFDDLIIYTAEILRSSQEVTSRWQDMFDHIEVDEVQDTSDFEYFIIERLSAENRSVFLVGDPDQNIYEWRHSDNRYLLDYDKTHEGCKTFILKNNYRSTKNILAVANAVIKKNRRRISKELTATKDDGECVTYKSFMSDYEAAYDILQRIKESRRSGESYSDNAILCRCQYTFKAMEDALRAHSIPFKIVGGVSFYDRSEVKDVIAYLTLLAKDDDPSLIRIINKPKRRFTPKRMAYLKDVQGSFSLYETIKKHQDDEKLIDADCYSLVETIERCRKRADEWGASKTIDILFKESGYLTYLSSLKGRDHVETFDEFIGSIKDYLRDNPEVKTIGEYLDRNSFLSETSQEREAVELMTVHAAKGLEFKNVYILGVNDDLFPHAKSMRERGSGAIEEERRLFYVAVTRAKDRLFLYSTSDKPSRFLKEAGLI